MYAIAIIGDILSLFPGVNVISGIITAMLLWIVGEATGVRIFSSARIERTLLMILIELVPVVSMFPAFTWSVYSEKKHIKMEEAAA